MYTTRQHLLTIPPRFVRGLLWATGDQITIEYDNKNHRLVLYNKDKQLQKLQQQEQERIQLEIKIRERELERIRIIKEREERLQQSANERIKNWKENHPNEEYWL